MLSSKAKAALYLVAGALLVPCVGTLGTSGMNAWAQPNAGESQIKAAWDKLQADSIELEATDPQSAITRYQGFFEEGGYRSPAVGLQISLRIARIYQIDLKNPDKAIEIYDWALSLYKDQPDAIALQKGRLAALEAQNRAENTEESKQPNPATGAAPLAVPLPKTATGGLGVHLGTLNQAGQMGIDLTSPVNPGMGVNPFSSSKPGGGPLGIDLASKVTATQPVSVSIPPVPALGWRAGPDRCITALAQQSDGTLWVATEDSGVWRYDSAVARPGNPWKQFTAKDGLADESAYALAVDQKGRVWAGTLNHGVSVWNGREWKNYGVLDGPLGERVFDIAVCPTDGDVWIATNAGLTRYSQQKDSWSYVTRADGLPSDPVQAIAFDKSGNIVLGTQCDGVALSQAADGYKTWRVMRGPEKMPLTATGQGLPTSLINDVLVARDGTIYTATTTGLAWSSDGGVKWAYVRGQDYADKVRGLYGGAPAGWKEGVGAVLAEDYVSCLAQNEAGQLWVGHWNAGSEMLQMQSGPKGLGVKEVFYRKESGFVKDMLPRDKGVLLLARYDEGLSYGSAAVEKNEEAPTADVKQKTGVGNMTVTLPVEAKSRATIELKIGVEDLTVKFPLTKANAVTEPQTEIVDATAPLPRIAKAPAIIEPKAVAVNTTVVSPTAVLPTAAKAPTLAELNAALASLSKIELLDPKTPFVAALTDDWTTQGDWLGRYGRYWASLNAMVSPGNYYWGGGWRSIDHAFQISPKQKDDGLRYWVQWLSTDNPRSLEMPPIYFDSRLQKGLATKDKYRRQAEIDDHAEAYPMTKEGPDIYFSAEIPNGLWTLSFYNTNKDGDGGLNRMRDYRYSIRPHDTTKPIDDVTNFDIQPELAKSRQRDFRGGVYKRFLVRGPQQLTIKMDKNNSFNTILAGAFLDLVDEQPAPYFGTVDEWQQRQQTRERQRVELSAQNTTERAARFAPATNIEEAAHRLFIEVERLRDLNPIEWAQRSRPIYQALARASEPKFKKASFATNTLLNTKTDLNQQGSIFYNLMLYNKWEDVQRQLGLIPAREIEKSLKWDGKSNSSGQGHNAIAHKMAAQIKNNLP